ncbi:phosphatase 2C-like domain-containing protein [Trametes meyenii]|nr:phosphatase 2C-like domain-containing protein [Trametes meyenii]
MHSIAVCTTNASPTGDKAIHTVTFQPLGNDSSADRSVVEYWTIKEQRWLCVAVLDGHVGTTTSEYTARMLPLHIRTKLGNFIEGHLPGSCNHEGFTRLGERITEHLKHEVCVFDLRLGEAVQQLCPEPWLLDEHQAKQLIQEHEEIFVRALEGTTVSMALINLDHRIMWAVDVVDSTIEALCSKDGTHQAERLREVHNFKNPHEFFRVIMSHTSAEKDIVDRDNKVLGWFAPSRAIGDFPLKMHPSFLRHVFQYLPSHRALPLAALANRVLAPPYATAMPHVRIVDLAPLWERDPVLLLYTDGVDHVVDGHLVFTPYRHSGVDPLAVASALLSLSLAGGARDVGDMNSVKAGAEVALGHPVEFALSRMKDNAAVDILGNLLGGTDVMSGVGHGQRATVYGRSGHVRADR